LSKYPDSVENWLLPLVRLRTLVQFAYILSKGNMILGITSIVPCSYKRGAVNDFPKEC